MHGENVTIRLECYPPRLRQPFQGATHSPHSEGVANQASDAHLGHTLPLVLRRKPPHLGLRLYQQVRYTWHGHLRKEYPGVEIP